MKDEMPSLKIKSKTPQNCIASVGQSFLLADGILNEKSWKTNPGGFDSQAQSRSRVSRMSRPTLWDMQESLNCQDLISNSMNQDFWNIDFSNQAEFLVDVNLFDKNLDLDWD